MSHKHLSRRTVLKGGAALGAATAFAQPLKAAAPPPSAVTPALVEAARKEGKASFYTALELNTSERLARTFEANIPGSPFASSVPVPSASISASSRNKRAVSMRWMWCAAPILAFSRLDSQGQGLGRALCH